MRNTAPAMAFVKAWEARDVDAILALMTPDARYVNVGLSEARGRDAIRAAIAPFLGQSSCVTWRVRHLAETGSGAVLTERVDEFVVGARTVSVAVMGVFEFEGGRIAAWRDYFDVADFQRQMAGG